MFGIDATFVRAMFVLQARCPLSNALAAALAVAALAAAALAAALAAAALGHVSMAVRRRMNKDNLPPTPPSPTHPLTLYRYLIIARVDTLTPSRAVQGL